MTLAGYLKNLRTLRDEARDFGDDAAADRADWLINEVTRCALSRDVVGFGAVTPAHPMLH